MPPYDANLIEALAGMPDCAGVAPGVDRLLMLLQTPEIAATMPFDYGRA